MVALVTREHLFLHLYKNYISEAINLAEGLLSTKGVFLPYPGPELINE